MSSNYINNEKTTIRSSQYRTLGLVGQGQYGRVFCAAHRQSGTLVALKELERQRFSTHKFLRELRFLLSLQHPNIVTCHALDQSQTARYLVMDYCEGGTLRTLFESKTQLGLVEGLKLIAQVLAGLDHAHSREIVHCDLKPENILLSLDNTGWIPRISDFGIARLSQEVGSNFLGMTGSPAYMAPERFYGQYSPASDVYAVGVMLFELALGRRPFSGLPGELMSAHLNKPVEIPNTLPFLLRSTISKALQKLPARRFASAAEMLKALQLAILAIDVKTVSASPDSAFSVSMGSALSNSHKERLTLRVTDLALESGLLYQASASKICCQSLTGGIQHPGQIQFPDSVLALMLRPQGCFVVTKSPREKSYLYSVYCLPKTEAFERKESQDCLERYKLFSVEGEDIAIAIDPQGRWIVVAQSVLEPCMPDNWVNWQIFSLPDLQPVKLPTFSRFPAQLFALDRRHAMAVYPQVTDEGNFTIFEIFNRRGGLTGALMLPLSLGRVTLSATSPYQVLGVEKNHPTLGLIIDLKPFKVRKIDFGIVPFLMTSTGWGYAIADRLGQIVLLDRQGRKFDTFILPQPPSAIAAGDNDELAIATWSGDRGTLYRLNVDRGKLETDTASNHTNE